jgi:hypothetical protein
MPFQQTLIIVGKIVDKYNKSAGITSADYSKSIYI